MTELKELKTEHNKVAKWVEFFSHKIKNLEDEIKGLKKENKELKEREDILAKTVLKMIK